MMERIRNGWFRVKSAARRAFEHRTKIVGGLGVGLGYVQNNQSQLHLFLPEVITKYSLIAVGAMAFVVGAYNTWILSRGSSQPPAP